MILSLLYLIHSTGQGTLSKERSWRPGRIFPLQGVWKELQQRPVVERSRQSSPKKAPVRPVQCGHAQHHQHWRLTSNMLIWKKGWNRVPCASTKERPSQIFGVTWRLTKRIDPKWFVDTAVDFQKCQKKQWRSIMWRHMDKREKSLVATCAITYFHREHMWPSIFRKFTEMSKLASQEINSRKESKVYSIWPNKIIAV